MTAEIIRIKESDKALFKDGMICLDDALGCFMEMKSSNGEDLAVMIHNLTSIIMRAFPEFTEGEIDAFEEIVE
jgi:hypothetical protein